MRQPLRTSAADAAPEAESAPVALAQSEGASGSQPDLVLGPVYSEPAESASGDYLRALEATGRYPHVIWPYHCLIGDAGRTERKHRKTWPRPSPFWHAYAQTTLLPVFLREVACKPAEETVGRGNV